MLETKKNKPKGIRTLPILGNRTARIKNKGKQYIFTEENMDAIIASWEALDKARRKSEQPLTIEPVRKRHSNRVYGKWCNKLMMSLRSSGRIFARHEFFYSDIDRAW